MPNQQQAENKEPQKAQNDNVERRPEYFDDPPPVIKAEGANESGEGDDAAGFQDADENEGEGNKTAGRNYNEGVKKHLKTKDVQKEADEAAEALDDEDERKDLEDAEEAARKGQIH